MPARFPPSPRSAAMLLLAPCLLSPRLSAMDLQLPTDNQAIFTDRPERFYMFVDRNFEGERSTPWQGGTYGFCRTPVRTAEGVINQKFHEGIDIAPTERDASGAPTDLCRAIADGTVVHVCDTASHSNYGRYVVVRHDWDGCPYFSLYAHLNDTRVETGDEVGRGTPVGRMGWTGEGIDRRRSHLHLEICLQLSEHFAGWYDRHYTTPNRHGDFNGINLLGLDVAQFLVDHHADSGLTVPQFLARRAEPYWQVLVPRRGDGELALVARYPWLRAGGEAGDAASWRLTFSGVGLPLRVEPDPRAVDQPTLVRVRPSRLDHRYFTRGHLSGTGTGARLSEGGRQFLELVLEGE